MASVSASARKPMRPRLMPSTGMSALRASSAARRKVPSPPSPSPARSPQRRSGRRRRPRCRRPTRAYRPGPGAAGHDRPLRRTTPEGQYRCRSTLSLPGVQSRWLPRGRCAPPAGQCAHASLRTCLNGRVTAQSSSSADRPRSVSARSHRKYSTLPDGPGSGLGGDPDGVPSSSSARRATASTAARPQLGTRAPPRRLPPAPYPPRTAASPWERYPRRATRIQSARATPWSAR